MSTSYAMENNAQNGSAPLPESTPSPVPATRGRRPAHSRSDIAIAGVGIADREGIAAVSMRRIATEIGTKATSLYRYVQSKDELLALMVDQVMGETVVPETRDDWREGLRTVAYQTRAILKRHPWLVLVPLRARLGPNSVASTEATLRVLDGHGLDADGMLLIAITLETFAQGYAAQEAAEQLAEVQSGLGRDQWMASQSKIGEAIKASGKYPLFTRIIEEAVAPHAPDGPERGFADSLECLLDGIGLRLK